ACFLSVMAKASHLDTLPYWTDSASLPRLARLDRDERVDVVIVGGGITRLTAADLLTAAGKSVARAVRDRWRFTDTSHPSAHLTMVTDRSLAALVNNLGREQAQAVWEAGLAAISQIAAIVRDERIDCDYTWVHGYKHAPIAQPPGDERRIFEEEARL